MQEKTKKLKNFAVLGGLVVGFVVLAYLASNVDFPGARILDSLTYGAFRFGRTTSTEPVSLKLKDKQSGSTITLTVPKAYLTDKHTWSGGTHDSIEIQTSLPDLMPREANITLAGKVGTEEHEKSLRLFRNGLFLRLIGEKLIPEYEKNRYEHVLQFYKTRKSDVYGLEHYVKEVCEQLDNNRPAKEPPTCRINDHVFVVPIYSKAVRVQFRCTPIELNPIGGCIADTRYRDWHLKYIFRHTEIERWEEFDTAARTLLDRFLVQQN